MGILWWGSSNKVANVGTMRELEKVPLPHE
jgi:hypothetical protein